MATTTTPTVLKTAIATYPHTQGLKDGTVTAPGLRFEHIEVSPIVAAFRRMCRTLEFDVSEMAITTYLTARAYNKPFTALPVFVLRQFHHAPIVYNVKSGIASPKDLEGKKVGVRAYTVTTGVWARGILATEYGVDLSKVTWVLNDEEHVEEYQKVYPSNVVYQAGANLGQMVANGELAAAIGVGRVDSPDVKPLIPNAREAEAAWYQKTGLYSGLAPSCPVRRRLWHSAVAWWGMIHCLMAWRATARPLRPLSSSRRVRRFCRVRCTRRKCLPATP
jgi:4,5-dihydroxyphthalate decarboxylase